jgi:hypothetical protein
MPNEKRISEKEKATRLKPERQDSIANGRN